MTHFKFAVLALALAFSVGAGCSKDEGKADEVDPCGAAANPCGEDHAAEPSAEAVDPCAEAADPCGEAMDPGAEAADPCGAGAAAANPCADADHEMPAAPAKKKAKKEAADQGGGW